MRTECAVIVLNYFGLDDTIACLDSVRLNLKSHIYLVDNSADPQQKTILEETYQKDSEVKLLFPSENLGFAAGVNLALREAVANGFARFLVLNNDAMLLKDAGLIFEKAFAEHPGSLIAPAIIWGNEICRGKYYHKYLGLITNKPLWKRKNYLFYLTGCAIAFDKKAFDRVGYFDESFFMYGEDVEYTHRAGKTRTPVVFLDETLVHHQGSKSTKMASLFYEYHIIRAHFLLAFRLFDSLPCSFLALLGKTIAMGSRACSRSVTHRTLSPLTAFFLGPFPLRIRPKRKP